MRLVFIGWKILENLSDFTDQERFPSGNGQEVDTLRMHLIVKEFGELDLLKMASWSSTESLQGYHFRVV